MHNAWAEHLQLHICAYVLKMKGHLWQWDRVNLSLIHVLIEIYRIVGNSVISVTRGEKVSARLLLSCYSEEFFPFLNTPANTSLPKRQVSNQENSTLKHFKAATRHHKRAFSLILLSVLGKDLKGLFFRSTIRNVTAIIKTLKVIPCARQELCKQFTKKYTGGLTLQ